MSDLVDGCKLRQAEHHRHLEKLAGNIRSTFLDHRSAVNIIRQNVHRESRLMTDTAARYKFAPGCQS